MMRIDLEIPILIVPKQTKGERIVTRRDGTRFVHHYTPKDVQQNVRSVERLLREYVPDEPLSGPLVVALFLWEVFPKSFPKYKREAGWWPRDTYPDCDNIAKNACDIMEAMGFYGRDGQISTLVVRTFWGLQRKTRIVIERERVPEVSPRVSIREPQPGPSLFESVEDLALGEPVLQ